MEKWIVSIVALIILNTILFLILPNGKNTTFIKGVFSIISFFAIISPLKELFSFDNVSFVSLDDVKIQEEYVNFAIDKRKNELEKNCLLVLNQKGLTCNFVSIDTFVDENYDFSIKNVLVELKKSVIISENEHIDISEKVKDAIFKFLKPFGDDFIVEVRIGE